MFLNFWIGWAFVGLVVATILFAWSVKTRQFSESKRASLLPFDDVTPTEKSETKNKGRGLWFTVLFIFVLCMGLLVITILLVP